MGWRNEHHAAAFMSSLAASSAAAGGPQPQVVFVVNGPEGEAAATIACRAAEDHGLQVAIVRLDTNTGFSGGANAGAALATGEIIIVANLDLTFDERFLSVLAREAADDRTWAFLAPRVLQGAAGEDAGVSRRTRSHRLAWVAPAPAVATTVPAGNGACLVLRRHTLERREAGTGALFDPEYHSFNEDIDLFWWADRRRLAVRYVPDLQVSHALAGSFAAGHRFRDRPVDIQRRVMANYRVTVWKNASGPAEWLGWLLGEAVYVGQAAIFGRLAGLRNYAASWPAAVRTAVAVRRRRGRLRLPASNPE